jgi:hypothetical protein
MADNPPLEIPPELRQLAERNIEQARAAYGQFMDLLTQAMDASSKAPSNAMMSGFSAVQGRAIELAKENAERFFALASELAHAKDVQEVLTLESQYAQAQMQAYALQAQELGRLMADAMPKFSPSISIP